MNDMKQLITRQREQLDKHINWVKHEGGIENPTWLNTWFSPQQQRRLKWIRGMVLSAGSESVIELGCNYGYVLAYCTHGITCSRVGVDVNEKVVELARILSPRSAFVCADIRVFVELMTILTANKLPVMYDTVLLTDVLEHFSFDTVLRVIDKCKVVAQKNLIITVPNGNYDTEESRNLKHCCLITSDCVKLMKEKLYPMKVRTHSDHYFIYIEALKH